ncbi:MAG: ABC transporter ATP-binding protein [Clostridiales bacterium]|nr:ABC transporter ATP-binding protein [Clostridiales bacterium]
MMKTLHKIRLAVLNFKYLLKFVSSSGIMALFIFAITSLAIGYFPVMISQIQAVLYNVINSYAMIHEYQNDYVVLIAVATALTYIVYNEFSSINIYRKLSLGLKVEQAISKKLIEKMQNIDLINYSCVEFRCKYDKIFRGANQNPAELFHTVLGVVSKIVALVSFSVIILIYSPLLLIPTFALSIIHMFISLKISNLNRVKNDEWFQSLRYEKYYEERLTDSKMNLERKFFRISPFLKVKYQHYLQQNNKKEYNYDKKKRILNFVLEATQLSLLAVFTLYLANETRTGVINIGVYSLILSSVTGIIDNMTGINIAISTFYESSLYANDMREFIEDKTTSLLMNNGEIKPKMGKGHKIEFKNVYFKYPDMDSYVFENLSFVIQSGESVAFVGDNGCGKTTIIKLICKLYTPNQGTILIDDVDIMKYDTAALYKLFGICFQKNGKYAFSVKDNIYMGNVDKVYDEERVNQSAVFARANEFVRQYKDGFSTVLSKEFDETATEPSEGEWKKIALARIFYRNSDIMMFDEPSASIDPVSEHELFNYIMECSKNKQIILISHRLGNIVHMDKIFLLDGGKVLEEGTHKELMRFQGEYYDIFTKQAQMWNEAAV